MRRFRLRKTGEVVAIISYVGTTTRREGDKVSFIDSKGIEHVDEHLNYYWDFEELTGLDDKRFQLAGMALQGILSRSVLHDKDEKEIAEKVLRYADALLEKMQNPEPKQEAAPNRKREDVPIGGFYKCNGKVYTAVKSPEANNEDGRECEGCDFHDDACDGCTLVECCPEYRNDKLSVIFKEVVGGEKIV